MLCSVPAIAAGLYAQSISGTIVIKKKLTKPSVTAPVSIYQWGTSAKLGTDAAQDPLVYERSRVVVYLEGQAVPDRSGMSPTQTEKIEQLDRRFVPDLVVVPVNSTVSFPNMDPVFHNVYSLSKSKTFDLGSYDKGQSRKVTFTKPGIVDIYCHLHPSMAATVVVTPNRWYARPDADGHYRIDDVPPGNYTLVAWHKSAGFFRRKVSIADGRNVAIDFAIPIDVAPGQDSGKHTDLARNIGSR
jgi:plastocyanin